MMTNPFSNNPLFARAQQMAEGKTPAELEQIALNICKEKGLDINEMMKQFQSLFGNKIKKGE
jgi:hypothetical protein